MKALFASILLLTAADWGLNHGHVSKAFIHGVGSFLGATKSETSSSVFSK